jgi:hypothetical protein
VGSIAAQHECEYGYVTQITLSIRLFAGYQLYGRGRHQNGRTKFIPNERCHVLSSMSWRAERFATPGSKFPN